jgi:hypothetical protein
VHRCDVHDAVRLCSHRRSILAEWENTRVFQSPVRYVSMSLSMSVTMLSEPA